MYAYDTNNPEPTPLFICVPHEKKYIYICIPHETKTKKKTRPLYQVQCHSNYPREQQVSEQTRLSGAGVNGAVVGEAVRGDALSPHAVEQGQRRLEVSAAAAGRHLQVHVASIYV